MCFVNAYTLDMFYAKLRRLCYGDEVFAEVKHLLKIRRGKTFPEVAEERLGLGVSNYYPYSILFNFLDDMLLYI